MQSDQPSRDDAPYSASEVADSNPNQSADVYPKRPWGFWATLGFSIVIMMFFFFAQTFGALLVVFEQTGSFALPPEVAKGLDKNGMAISVATILAFLVCTPLILIIIALKRGLSVRDYIDLRLPSLKDGVFWSVIFLILIVGIEGLNIVLEKPAVPEFMKSAYASMPNPFWLFIAVAIAAPVLEEVFFRGFVLEGMRNSKLGMWGAVILSSAAWAVIHVQYGIYEISIIFVMGIVLGLARLRGKSLLLVIFLHALNNSVAMIQTAFAA